MTFLPALAALKGFALLVRGEFGFAAELDAARLGAGASFAGPRADQLALELGEAAENGEHQAAVGCGGVGPRVTERAKPGLLAGDRRESVGKVAGRAGETVEPR